MIKSDISINAGAIGQLLSEKGILSIREISEVTKYNSFYITLALGWLARENKVRFIDEGEILYVELNRSPSDMYY